MPQPMICEYYDIAGVVLKVTARGLRLASGGVLEAFRTTPRPWDHSIALSLVEKLSPPEGEEIFSDSSRRVYRQLDRILRYNGPVEQGLQWALMRIERNGNHSDVELLGPCPDGVLPQGLLLQAMEITHTVTASGGCLLHAAHILWNGRAILFTAPSGVGKTTQAQLWEQYRAAAIVNGDRAAIRAEEDGVFALGVPYGGSSGIACPGRAKLAAIVYVRQAAENRVRRLSGLDAFRKIWEGCSLDTWSRQDVSACTDAVLRALEQVPVWLLECTPDEGAVEALEGVLEP